MGRIKFKASDGDLVISTGLADWVVYAHPVLRYSGHCIELLVGCVALFRLTLWIIRSQVGKRASNTKDGKDTV